MSSKSIEHVYRINLEDGGSRCYGWSVQYSCWSIYYQRVPIQCYIFCKKADTPYTLYILILQSYWNQHTLRKYKKNWRRSQRILVSVFVNIYFVNCYFATMIVLPWFVRFGLDCTVALTPIVYFHYHPSLFVFEYFQNRRRIVRRQSNQSLTQHSNNSPASKPPPQSPCKKARPSSSNWVSKHDLTSQSYQS